MKIGKTLVAYTLIGSTLCFFLFFQMGCAGTSPKKVSKVKRQAGIEAPPSEKRGKVPLKARYKEGAQALKEGNYEKAIDTFIDILTVDPNYGDVQKKLIMAHQAKRKRWAERKKEEEKAPLGIREYTVNHGDVLSISVWRWPDLREPEVYVRPDGKISFPLVGDVQVVGRTLTEIDRELTERLEEYIKSPEVSLSIRRFGGRKVIVLGEVSGPGVYAPTGMGTLLEVIALAGGFRNSAVTSNVVVVRGDTLKSEAIICDLRRALKGGDLSQNIRTEANDIVYVPRRFISSVSDLAAELGTQVTTVLTGDEVARDFNIMRAGN